MHHFAVALFANPNEDLLQPIDGFIKSALTFKPEIAVATRSGGCLVASFQANARQFGVESWAHVAEDEAVLLFGLPTFENYSAEAQAIARTAPARGVLRAIAEKGFEALSAQLGGVFSVVYVKDGEIRTSATFCGYGSLMMYAAPDRLIVGNKLPLILALVPDEDKRPDHLAASWLYTTTMILGDRTPFLGIRKIPPGHSFRGTLGKQEITLDRPSFVRPPEDDSEEARREVFDRFIRRYEYYLDLPIEWRAHITGGKDSRAALAAILASGKASRIERFLTTGGPENGDVIIARQIAERAGLANHVVSEGAKKPDLTEEDIERHYQRFRYTPWKFDGQLTPWDGAGQPATTPPSFVTFMGGGGEIYRQKGMSFPLGDPETCRKTFRNWYYTHNALGLATEDVAEWQAGELDRFLQQQFELGTVNLQTALYIFHRLSNWGAAHFQNNASPSVASLVDLNLARRAHLSEDCQDSIHYEIIRQCRPDLLEIPLVNDTWDRGDASLPPPLKVETKKNFPWQYELGEKRWGRLIDEILEGTAVLKGTVDAEAVKKLRSRGPVLQSAPLKMLFGVRMMISLYSGESRGKPDFFYAPYEPLCVGELSSQVERAFVEAGFMRPRTAPGDGLHRGRALPADPA